VPSAKAAGVKVFASLACAAAVLAACSTGGERQGAAPAQGGAPGVAGTPPGSGASSGMSAAGDASSAGGGTGGTNSGLSSLMPARIRRLANAEYDASVRALLATTQTPTAGSDFPPDLRQDGFTVNDAQRIDALIIERLAVAADALVVEARENGTLARLAPCEDGEDSTSCAERFIRTFGAKVYRRPLLDAEASALLQLYAIGAEDATYEDGVAHVTRGLLQSAGFLYLTELGEGAAVTNTLFEMTPHEIAASLSYVLTSGPPDDELREKAESGAIAEPAERAAQARRLLSGDPRAKDTVVRLVREWLGIDRIGESAKDSLVYPDFASEKPRIVAESLDFVRAVAFESTGNVSELLGATWTVNSGPLGLYQTDGSGPLDGTSAINGRVGILNQAAFLATYANAHESHPIFRGVAIARRVTCLNLDSPASFNIDVVPPVPDPTKTTRERFSVHPADSICAGCHDTIDPFGFSFEHFDGMGAYRDRENGAEVDSAVELAVDVEFDGTYADSNELARVLSENQTVRECFARFMYRAAMATGDSAATPGEAEFIEVWNAIPAAKEGSMVETLVAYAGQSRFATRVAP
jgi:hypothetical protein